jgi:DNA-binding transcriptional regulator YhcF (GntR family)
MTKTNKRKSKPTTKNMKIPEQRELVDPKTGEKILVDSFVFEERDANFHKIWLWHIIQALDLIGNQKIKILSYILENVNADNLFIGTQRDIADATGTAKQTVTDTMNMLQQVDIIKMRQHGVYFVNPNAIFKGNSKKRMNILYQYYDVETKKTRVNQ